MADEQEEASPTMQMAMNSMRRFEAQKAAERDAFTALERAVLTAAEEWREACRAADANQADYVDGGETWQRCRKTNLALRKSVDELLRARGEGGE